MTKLEQLKKEKRDAKHMMFMTRPLRGYLGNQFEHWNRKHESAKEKINKLK